MLKKIPASISLVSKIITRQCCAATHCPTGPTDPGVQISVLPNGMRIATEETSSPISCVSLCVAAGSRYETASKHGLTHFIEHLAYKGFKSMHQTAFEQCMYYLGAKLTVKTEREMQIFSMTLPSKDAIHAVDVFHKCITDLSINDATIGRGRYNVCLESQDTENDPESVVFDYLHETAYQGTPLAKRVMGPSRNIEIFDAATTTAFMCEHYQPYRFTLATSGDVKHDKMVLYAQERFGCLCPQPCCEPDPGPCRYTGSEVIYRDDSMPFAHVAIAFEAPGFTSPDYIPMLVAGHICGHWDRSQPGGELQAPLIAQAASHEQLCERYRTFYIAYRDSGLWGVYFIGKRFSLDDMWNAIQNQLMHLCVTTTARDLERGVNNARLGIAKERFNGAVNSSHDIGRQVLYTKGRQSYDSICSELATLKSVNLREIADKYLYERCPAVAAMGPSEALPEYNRIRSGMYWLRT